MQADLAAARAQGEASAARVGVVEAALAAAVEAGAAAREAAARSEAQREAATARIEVERQHGEQRLADAARAYRDRLVEATRPPARPDPYEDEVLEGQTAIDMPERGADQAAPAAGRVVRSTRAPRQDPQGPPR